MLKLLAHSLAGMGVWSDYEKSFRWTVMTLAFWGGFRLSKLLLERRYEFDLMSCLLPSDIQFRDVTLWLRNPKIGSRFGDLVELWKMDECKGIEKELFREEDTLPVFVH